MKFFSDQNKEQESINPDKVFLMQKSQPLEEKFQENIQNLQEKLDEE